MTKKYFLLCFLLTLLIQAIMAETASAQTAKLSLNMVNKTVKEVLDEVEKQSDYVFFYSDETVDLKKTVTLEVKDQPIDQVLNRLFAGSNNTYTIKNRQVYINKKTPAQAPETSAKSIELSGIVISATDNQPLIGVSVFIDGTGIGTTTDVNGEYTLTVPASAKEVSFSYLGYITLKIAVKDRNLFRLVTIYEDSQSLEEVTVVAFSKQKKESVIGSISTINTKDLRVPSSNLTTAFAGRIAGMISYQTSGEPGRDNAEFFIRGVTSFGAGKVDPLILIDNVEVSSTDLSKYHPDDIASFSILKDATATALYGARGANGVILITTKEGSEGKVKVSVRLENSFSQPTKNIQMADPITYMQMANEATATRNPFIQPPYSKSRIEDTKDPNRNQYVFPAVDWMDMLTKDVAMNQRANLNISGGGAIARYYIAGSFSQDNGILDVDKRSSFNNNIDYKQYLIRSNININLTKTTEAVVRVHGTFDGYTGPIVGGNDMYKRIMNVSPVRFPAYYQGVNDEVYANAAHILFGGSSEGFINPYAEMMKGYREENRSTMMAQMEVKQDFSQWVQGLTARILGNTTRYSGFDLTRAYSPFYYQVQEYDRINDQYTLRELNPSNGGGQFLVYSPGYKTQNSSTYAEASVAYNRTFDEKHATSGMLVGIVRNAITANASTLIGSLPQRNLGLSGRFTYGYDSRYFAEFNFGYNGSEKFDKNHRWGFFPSVGLGWAVNNEAFWTDEMSEIVSKLKIRGTYGLVGNDEIGTTRFFYLSDVTIGNGVSYLTGYDFNGTNRAGVLINNYPNPLIGWETSYKTNIGLELGLFNGKIEMQADLFREKRTNIVQYRQDIPTEMGLWRTPQANLGIADGKGIDVSLDYNQVVNKDIWLVGRANFTYARSTFNYYEEPDYDFAGTPWRSRIGYPLSQKWGYVAERLFIDEEDVENSPRQDFGPYGAGDIKYKDINGDRVINEIDQVPIGRPTSPEINYGFGLSFGYKKLDVSLFFSGSARSSFWIDAESMMPFVLKTADRGNGNITADLSKGDILMETGLAKFIADDYWSESSQNPYAKWPRLSNTLLANNTQQSTMFMKDGDFLRLKSLEIGYSLPERWIGKAGLTSCRFYLSGTNLLLFSKFKLWDVELGGNGLNYPLQRVVNLGVNLSF